jgi:hypothetical protein
MYILNKICFHKLILRSKVAKQIVLKIKFTTYMNQKEIREKHILAGFDNLSHFNSRI